MVVYGAFSEVSSRDAGRCVDQLVRLGVDVEWRVVVRNAAGPVSPAAAAVAALDGASAHQLRRALFTAYWESALDIAEPAVLEGVLGEAPVYDERRATYWQRAWQGLERPDLPLVRLTTGYVFRGPRAIEQLAGLVRRRTAVRGRRRSRGAAASARLAERGPS
jgi:hypothetical protein